MIEKILLDWVRQVIPAHMELPEDFPSVPFVVLEKTGGGMENHIKTATIIAQSYGGSLLEAAETNERVKERILGAVALNEIARVELNSEYNYTDPSTKRYRYQAVFDIVYY